MPIYSMCLLFQNKNNLKIPIFTDKTLPLEKSVENNKLSVNGLYYTIHYIVIPI